MVRTGEPGGEEGFICKVFCWGKNVFLFLSVLMCPHFIYLGVLRCPQVFFWEGRGNGL